MFDTQTTRRSFLRASGVALAALALPATVSAAARAASGLAAGTQAIGVQLYTLRALMAEDVAGTLAKVGAIGYREVEFAGYFDKSFADIRRWLADAGLTAPSAHIRIENLETRFDAALEAAHALGHKTLFLAWLPPEQRTIGRFREIAALLNQKGEQAKAAGVQLGYHNHDFEFKDQDGTKGYDVLLTETDPDLVKFEADLYWLRVAGVDPFALFKAYPGRFPCVHVKDYGADGSIVDVGDGQIDFGAIYRVRQEAGIQHYFIEHDSTKDPLRTIERSFKAFNRVVNG